MFVFSPPSLEAYDSTDFENHDFYHYFFLHGNNLASTSVDTRSTYILPPRSYLYVGYLLKQRQYLLTFYPLISYLSTGYLLKQRQGLLTFIPPDPNSICDISLSRGNVCLHLSPPDPNSICDISLSRGKVCLHFIPPYLTFVWDILNSFGFRRNAQKTKL